MALPAVIIRLAGSAAGRRLATSQTYKAAARKYLKEDVEHELDERVDKFVTQLKVHTPKDTGKASQGWKKTEDIEVGKSGDTTIIKNNVPYIDPLEHGHSKQAPKGIIDPAFRKAFK